MSQSPPANWYPDPDRPDLQRYWDGTAWTEHTAPAVRPQPAVGGFQPPTPAGTAPDPWLWQSIVVTLLCCLPLGIAGIVYASRSSSAWSAGDVAGAHQAAGTARTLTLWAVGVALGALVLWFLVVFLGFGLAATGAGAL